MIYLRLPKWTSSNAAASNAMLGLFPSPARWTETLRSALSDLLVRPAGHRVTLTASHKVEPAKPPVTAAFAEGELTIGRGETCGLSLPEATIGREHARVLAANGTVELEDLGTRVGTFVGERRLLPNVPEPLGAGASFTIYPYSIECRVEQFWEPDPRMEIAAITSGWWQWRDVPRERMIGCEAKVEPGAGSIWIGAQHDLVHEAVRGVLGTDRLDAPGLADTDAGCLDYLLNVCLERCNAAFAWPLRIDWQRWGASAALPPDTHGLLLHVPMRLRDASGVIRLFVPDSVLGAIPRSAAPALPGAFERIPIPCCAQLRQTLSAAEAGTLEPGDAVLLDATPVLMAPGADLGWKCTAVDDNFAALRIDNAIERISRLSIQPPEEAGALAETPVTFQVILANKEIPLGELRTLAAGALIDLGRDETSPVRLAINGKTMGEGELVRIDNRLGVKVLGWNV